MTMQEAEKSILSDLAMLGDGLNRMEYLLGCAGAYAGIPTAERVSGDLVTDCQTNTWLRMDWAGERLTFRADSESALVKGALSLLAELYDGRTRQEVRAFSCTLLSCGEFRALFSDAQRKGLQSILNALRG